jgi:hypothetical protein
MTSPTRFDWFSWLENFIIKMIILALLLIVGYKLVKMELSTINHGAPVSAPVRPEKPSASLSGQFSHRPSHARNAEAPSKRLPTAPHRPHILYSSSVMKMGSALR